MVHEQLMPCGDIRTCLLCHVSEHDLALFQIVPCLKKDRALIMRTETTILAGAGGVRALHSV